jgi:hypothetical protein
MCGGLLGYSRHQLHKLDEARRGEPFILAEEMCINYLAVVEELVSIPFCTVMAWNCWGLKEEVFRAVKTLRTNKA